MQSASSYKQVRVTLTEEPEHGSPETARITLRVMVKPANAQWNMRQTVLHEVRRTQPRLHSLDDVYGMVIEMLSATPFPE